MNDCKKKIMIGLSILCLTLVLCIAGPFLARNMYIHNLITRAKPVGSYDGKFAFLEMPSPKWYVRNLNIYDTSHPIGKQQVETFSHGYNKYDMKEIMWGNQSYDLFFDIPEGGPYMYKFDAEYDRWVGPLYFDESETKEKRLQGDNDSYCFESGYNTNEEEFPEYPFGESTIVEKDTIPKNYLKNLDSYLSQN